MRWELLLDNIVDAVIVFGADMSLLYANQAALELLPNSGDGDLSGIEPLEVVAAHDRERVQAVFLEMLENPGSRRQERFMMRYPDDAIRWVEVTATNRVDEPDVEGIVCSFRDLTARRQLARQAHLDPLTNVGNRLMLTSYLDRTISSLGDDDALLLAFLDLDHFKAINDGFGHEAGDQIIETVARRLATNIRPSDLVCRLGGDEFVVAFQGDGIGDSDQIGQRLQNLVSAPIALEGRDMRLTASIGLAYATKGSTTVDLMRCADQAMYAAKDAGRATHVVFGPKLAAATRRRAQLSSQIRTAFTDGRLRSALQPITTADGKTILAYEALMRWEATDGTIHSAGEALERCLASPFMCEIDLWMIRRCSALLSASHAEGNTDAAVSVNVSASTLRHPAFIPAIEEILENSSAPPAALWFELTEKTLVNVDGVGGSALRTLHDLGTRLAIDDFGSGFSSMGYLRDLPVDMVKVDKRFVLGVETDRRDVAVCEAIVSMAHALGMTVIAEGIESESQRLLIEDLGFDMVQGFYIGRPDIFSPLHKTNTAPVIDLRKAINEPTQIIS